HFAERLPSPARNFAALPTAMKRSQTWQQPGKGRKRLCLAWQPVCHVRELMFALTRPKTGSKRKIFQGWCKKSQGTLDQSHAWIMLKLHCLFIQYYCHAHIPGTQDYPGRKPASSRRDDVVA